MEKGKFIILEGLTCCGKGKQAGRLKRFLESIGISALIYAEPTSSNSVGKMIRKIIEKQKIDDAFVQNVFVPEVLAYIVTLGVSGVFLKGPERNDVVKEFAGLLNSAMIKIKNHEKLTNRELQSLYVMDRHLDLRENIIPALENGIWVIQDRYDRSTMAFGKAFGGVTIEEVYKWHLHVLGEEYIFPDYDFFICIKPETAMERLQKDGKVKDQFEQKFDGLQKTAAAYKEVVLFMCKQYGFQNPPKDFVVVIDGEKNEQMVFKKIKEEILLSMETKKINHSRGLCGKPDVLENTPKEDVEKNPAHCLCCGSEMEIHDPVSVTMQQLGVYALVCPKCPKKAE